MIMFSELSSCESILLKKTINRDLRKQIELSVQAVGNLFNLEQNSQYGDITRTHSHPLCDQ